jgi:hypothetical protein
VLKLIEGSSCASEPRRLGPVEARAKPAEEPESKKSIEQPKALSPLQRMELPKELTGQPKIPATTSKRRRMASVLDAVMESAKGLTPASAEVPSAEGEIVRKSVEAGTAQAAVEAGPSVPAEARPSEAAEEGAEARPSEAAEGPLMLGKEGATEEYEFPAPGAPAEDLEFIVHHASGKKLSNEQIVEEQHYARDLQYPQGSLVYGGDNEDDFLYCLPDNKEIHVSREMADNIGYPKLELGLSAMTKDQLADSLAYNSLKVRIL